MSFSTSNFYPQGKLNMLYFKLVGIRDAKYEALRKELYALLEELNVDAIVEEVNQVSKIIQHDIEMIPALMINGGIIYQNGQLSNMNNMKAMIKKATEKQSASQQIRHILVPTDFSDVSVNALKYAMNLAQSLGADIKLLHLFQPAFDPTNPYSAEPFGIFVDAQQTAMDAFVERQKEAFSEDWEKVKITPEVSVGFAADEIVRLSETDEVDMIIMGMTGQSGVLEKIFGSVSSAVAQRAHCPVLLIPAKIEYEPYKNILYASNLEATDEDMIQDIMNFAGQFTSSIHFVHVQENDDDVETYQVEDNLFEQIFKDGDPTIAFNMCTIKSSSVVSGLNQYAEENEIDLLVMVTRHRNFVQSLIHKSITRKMAVNTHLPIMVMHMGEKIS